MPQGWRHCRRGAALGTAPPHRSPRPFTAVVGCPLPAFSPPPSRRPRPRRRRPRPPRSPRFAALAAIAGFALGARQSRRRCAPRCVEHRRRGAHRSGRASLRASSLGTLRHAGPRLADGSARAPSGRRAPASLRCSTASRWSRCSPRGRPSRRTSRALRDRPRAPASRRGSRSRSRPRSRSRLRSRSPLAEAILARFAMSRDARAAPAPPPWTPRSPRPRPANQTNSATGARTHRLAARRSPERPRPHAREPALAAAAEARPRPARYSEPAGPRFAASCRDCRCSESSSVGCSAI